MKLCVAQIRGLKSFRGVHNSHCLYGHPVSRCCIAGVVVGVAEKASFSECALPALLQAALRSPTGGCRVPCAQYACQLTMGRV